MAEPVDDGLRSVLDALGVAPSALLGRGGEAAVYAIGPDRIVRILHDQGLDDVQPRIELVEEIRAMTTQLPFAIPEVLDMGTVGERSYVIERRLEGTAVNQLLAGATPGRERRQLVVAHLDTAAALADLGLRPRPWFGDLIAPSPVRADTWSRYLREKLVSSLEQAPGFDGVDVDAICAELPEAEQHGFVHLDAFGGNMLATGQTITAVIDFGVTALVGDRRLDPLTAAVYVCSDRITPEATESDRQVVHHWLDDRGLADWYEPVRRWIAGYWAFAVEDRALHQWCREVLLPRRS